MDRDGIYLEASSLGELLGYEFHEIIHVLEIVVDRGESYIRHLVDVFKLIEDILSDPFGCDSPLVRCPLILELVEHLFDPFKIDIAFMQGFENAALQLGAIVDFLDPVILRDEEVYEFHPFERGES